MLREAIQLVRGKDRCCRRAEEAMLQDDARFQEVCMDVRIVAEEQLVLEELAVSMLVATEEQELAAALPAAYVEPRATQEA